METPSSSLRSHVERFRRGSLPRPLKTPPTPSTLASACDSTPVFVKTESTTYASPDKKRKTVSTEVTVITPRTSSRSRKTKKDLEDNDWGSEVDLDDSVKPKQKAETPAKKRRTHPDKKVADLELYAHLEGLPDYTRPGLEVVFCGIK